MGIDHHIEELRAELANGILTRTERAAIEAELTAARAEQERARATRSEPPVG